MEPRQFLNHTISQVIGVRETKGSKFGIELELEGRGVGLADVATRGWTRNHDGSLRGESIEFATQGAKTFDESRRLVTELFEKFKNNKVKFNNSIRTSTHVHLNFSDRKVKEMINFFSLFTLLEEVLQYYSGEDRKGNLFCISTREAEGIMGEVFTSVARGDLSKFAGDRYKYAACNLSSLFKFGTVEVRTMKGASSADQVNQWLSILNDMYEYSIDNMRSPVELVTDLSHLGADGLLRKIFKPENYQELMNYFPKPATLHHSLMEGARIIQIMAYMFDDDFTAEVEIKKPDPNGRLPHKLANGHNYQVYDRRGRPWNCFSEREGLEPAFWEDGEACIDNREIRWNAGLQRFVQTDGAGRVFVLNWARHHAMPNEGPARREFRPARMLRVGDMDVEVNEEVDFDRFAEEDDEEA